MNDRKSRTHKLHATATQRDIAFFRERDRERQVAAEKTAGLRALRMAKEASERAAAEAAAAAKPAKPPRKRTSKSAAAKDAVVATNS